MLEGTISIIKAFGEIGLHLLDSAGSILVTLVVLWVIYTLAKSIFSGAKKIWNGNEKK